MQKKMKSTKRATDPVKKNMDKFTRPSTHIDRKKQARKTGDYGDKF